MPGHYSSQDAHFALLERFGVPAWRPPQRGALGALLAHWSLPHKTPALISIPTGSGKTAVAMAAPYLMQADRVLVVVPSKDLRHQTVTAFETEAVLRSVGARSGDMSPRVVQVTGRVEDWSVLYEADVVVALPNSISPVYYSNPPPPELFDLVVVDEAHHAPAPTWQAILDHFNAARGVLLTATPQRRDGRRVPGDLIYHYPLRQALDEGFYKPVRAEVLDLPDSVTRGEIDRRITAVVIDLARRSEHRSSSVLIRASSIQRANDLAALYRGHGLEVEVLTYRASPTRRTDVVERLRRGQVRAVAVVGMLGEGFDLPSFRIAAYHDKHKSANATVQLIGRLARTDPAFPQESVIVTARDIDVYPQLEGVVRSLWEEDADWAVVLPGIIDNAVADSIANREYAELLPQAPPELSVEGLQPVVRLCVYEVPVDGWEPEFVRGVVPGSLIEGQRLQGHSIIYAACTPTNATLVIVTAAAVRPRWHADPGLDSMSYNLHLVTWRPATQTDQANVLIVNTSDEGAIRPILKAVGAFDRANPADPRRLQDAFDSLDRVSVSNVGLRNTYLGTRGVPSYRTFAGSGVERGLREADTARGALGHAMAQISSQNQAFTAGIATGKNKLWETRYVPLREYETSVGDYIDRYWFPPADGPGRLLPNVTRGERLREFPGSGVAAVELNPALYGQGWARATNGTPMEELDFRVDPSRPATPTSLPLQAWDPTDSSAPAWLGQQDILGYFTDHTPAEIRRGFAAPTQMADLLTNRPPNVYFLDGQTVVGAIVYRSLGRLPHLPDITYEQFPQDGIDIEAETRRNAESRGIGKSIHEALEDWLRARPRLRKHRWILCNDGPGEIADYIVLEIDPGLRVAMALWHAKAAAGRRAAVRVGDMQTVTAQAIKSRRWVTDRTLWAELGARLDGRSRPPLVIVEGRERLLRALCGLNDHHPGFSFTRCSMRIDCEIGIVQPGLSLSRLRDDVTGQSPTVAGQQIRELLSVWHDAVGSISSLTLLGSP